MSVDIFLFGIQRTEACAKILSTEARTYVHSAPQEPLSPSPCKALAQSLTTVGYADMLYIPAHHI